jgi:hypothetical protein
MFERREGAVLFSDNVIKNSVKLFFLFKMQEKWDMQHWGSDDCLAERPKKLKKNN